jgi:hypothetical protein
MDIETTSSWNVSVTRKSFNMQLKEHERRYLELISERTPGRQITKSTRQQTRQNITKQDLKDSGVDNYTQRPDKIVGSIEEKADKLPDRIEALIEDIQLLNETGFLNSEERDLDWDDLVQSLTGEHPSRTDDDIPWQRPASPPRYAEGPLSKLIGEILLYLLAPACGDNEELATNMEYGFIHGVSEAAFKDIEQRVEQWEAIRHILDREIEESHRQIERFEMQQEGFDPAYFSRLPSLINSRIRNLSGKEVSNVTQGELNEISSAFVHEVWEALSEEYYDGYPLDKALLKELNKEGIVEEWELHEQREDTIQSINREFTQIKCEINQRLSRKKIQTVLNENPDILEREKLRQLVDKDISELAQLSSNGISPLDIIRSISDESTTRKTAKDLAESSEKSVDETLPATAKICRYLSGNNGETWGKRDYPKIISINNRKERFDRWEFELTDYGLLIQSTAVLYSEGEGISNSHTTSYFPPRALNDHLKNAQDYV